MTTTMPTHAWTLGDHVVRVDTNRHARIIAVMPLRAMVRIQYDTGEEDTLPMLLIDPVLPRSTARTASWGF